MWLERAIVLKLHGEEHRQFAAIQGDLDMQASIDRYQEANMMEYTKLCPQLKSTDPDDAFSSIPYEKGFQFLYSIEQIMGYDIFCKFTHAYINNFKYKSVTAIEFKDYLLMWTEEKCGTKSDDMHAIDFNKWFYSEGRPPVEAKFDQSLLNQVLKLVDEWLTMKTCQGFDNLSIQQRIYMLDVLIQRDMPLELVKEFNKMYEFLIKPPGNMEIQFRIIRLNLKCKNKDIMSMANVFLETQGRMKYVRPLYRTLKQSFPEEAIEIFAKNKTRYHPICSKLVGHDLSK